MLIDDMKVKKEYEAVIKDIENEFDKYQIAVESLQELKKQGKKDKFVKSSYNFDVLDLVLAQYGQTLMLYKSKAETLVQVAALVQLSSNNLNSGILEDQQQAEEEQRHAAALEAYDKIKAECLSVGNITKKLHELFCSIVDKSKQVKDSKVFVEEEKEQTVLRMPKHTKFKQISDDYDGFIAHDVEVIKQKIDDFKAELASSMSKMNKDGNSGQLLDLSGNCQQAAQRLIKELEDIFSHKLAKKCFQVGDKKKLEDLLKMIIEDMNIVGQLSDKATCEMITKFVSELLNSGKRSKSRL